MRLLGLLFITGIITCTVLVTAMSIWGIVKVETDVRDVVPETFDFINDTERQLSGIHVNLSSAVTNGNSIVSAIRVAVVEIQNDPSTELLTQSDVELNETFFELIRDLERATDDADEALDTVDTEINAVRHTSMEISLCALESG